MEAVHDVILKSREITQLAAATFYTLMYIKMKFSKQNIHL